MTANWIPSVLVAMWGDLRQPDLLWQLAALAASVLLGWALSRTVRVSTTKARPAVMRMGAGGLNRIVFPLVVMVLLVASRAVLSRWTNVNLLTVAISLAASLAGIRFIVYLLRMAFAPGGGLAAWERAITTTIWVIVALYLTGLLPEIHAALESVNISIGKQKFTLMGALESVFWILVTLLIALWAGSAVEARLMRAQRMNSNIRGLLARVTKAALLVVAVLIVLPVLGIDLTVLSVFGGALGVGLGFGLQKIASNYLSGFIILIDRSIRIGDWITADHHYGEVKQITTRYTVVRSQSGVEAIIPNDTLITTTVLNNTYADKQLRMTIKLSVAYSSDIEAVLKLLPEIASRHPRVLKDPVPNALVTGLGDSGIELELGYWIGDQENGRVNLSSEISVWILSEFKARGIEIPFPQREVRMLGQPAA